LAGTRGDLVLSSWSGLATATVILVLAIFLSAVALEGYKRLTLGFLTSPPSSDPDRAGIMPALAGSIWVVTLATMIAVPLGTALSLYITEFLPSGRLRGALYFVVEVLAGVPSVVYGIVGLSFVGYILGLGRTVATGAVALAFLMLPLVVVAATEALRSVPDSLRLGAYALGASRVQVALRVTLPIALPGILTGSILAVARALGETAPILVISGLIYTRLPPKSALDEFTVLPLQVFNWISRPQEEFRELASAGIIVLLVLFIALNALAFHVRARASRRLVEV